jgi:hypothetical protein
LAAKFEVLLPNLDERQRRLLLGADLATREGITIPPHAKPAC